MKAGMQALSPEAERLVREQLASGHYRNADEVVEIALQAFGAWEPDKELEAGLAEAGRGETVPAEDAIEEIRAKYGFPR